MINSTQSPRVSVVLPTYKEAEGIERFLLSLRSVAVAWAEAENCSVDQLVEVIVVDDNSPDGTADRVRDLSVAWPVVRLIVRTANRGLGLPILDGVRASRGQILVGMDADNNHDPTQIPSLVENLRSADLVVASRFIGNGGMQEIPRWIATWLFNLGLRLLGFPIWDNFSGFYAVRKLSLLDLRPERIYYGYGDYHLRLVFYAASAGLKIKEIPTTYLRRFGGQSKSHLFEMAYNYAKEVWRLKYSKQP